MNIYRIEFFAFCPVTPARIKYELTIENPSTDNKLMAEDLVDAVTLIDKGMHEEIADQLFREFGGRQTLKAHHHGVDIETRRGWQ